MSENEFTCSAGCFFFQAEDGIRDYKVTGVQTCALPILPLKRPCLRQFSDRAEPRVHSRLFGHPRSEEHTSELQSPCNLVCRLLLEKKKINKRTYKRQLFLQIREKESSHMHYLV